MTNEELENLQKLYDASTPGEWIYGHIPPEEEHDTSVIGADGVLWIRIAGQLNRESRYDSAFITAAHNAMPQLLAEVRELRDRVCEMELDMSGDGVRMGLVDSLQEKRQQLAASQEQNRRLAEENERTAVEKSDLMGANRRQIKVIGRLREMLLMSYQPADSEDGATFRRTTDADIDAGLAKE